MFIIDFREESNRNNYEYYCFRNIKGKKICWPINDGAYLGTAGIWNVLFRLGFHPKIVFYKSIPQNETKNIFIYTSQEFEESHKKLIHNWLNNGETIIATGLPEAWKSFFPANCSIKANHLENPYYGLAYIFPGQLPEIIAPPRWTFLQIKSSKSEDLKLEGNLAAVHGERQTPSRAIITKIENSFAVIKYRNFIYLNGNPFASFQAWLQGQENLEPWILWRHRFFWLDEYAAYLGKLLNRYGILKKLPGPGITELKSTTIVLRHDVDSSKDTSYMIEEDKNNLKGVYAVLRDSNVNFWLESLNSDINKHEIAFHYDTSESLSLRNYWLLFKEKLKNFNEKEEIGRLKKIRLPIINKPSKKKIVGRGLLKQVLWAKRKGIDIFTLHRHNSFIVYPELIDAMNIVYNELPEVLGSSSLFRAQVLRWGVDRVENMMGNLGYFPDIQFPIWFPFKLSHSGLNGLILRGWESSSIMEIEPDFFQQIIDYKIPELSQKIIILNYHPAHANKPTFKKDGSYSWFKDIIKLINERCIEVKTLRNVYEILDRQEF